MNIKPIKTKKDYRQALAEVKKIWGAKFNTPNGDKLDVMVTLIEAYEKKHYPISSPDPIDAIKFRMEQQGLRKVDLAPILGGKNRVSEVLSRKKPLTLKMIKSLRHALNMSYDSLIETDFVNCTNAHRILVDTPVKIGQRGRPVRELVDT